MLAGLTPNGYQVWQVFKLDMWQDFSSMNGCSWVGVNKHDVDRINFVASHPSSIIVLLLWEMGSPGERQLDLASVTCSTLFYQYHLRNRTKQRGIHATSLQNTSTMKTLLWERICTLESEYERTRSLPRPRLCLILQPLSFSQILYTKAPCPVSEHIDGCHKYLLPYFTYLVLPYNSPADENGSSCLQMYVQITQAQLTMHSNT